LETEERLDDGKVKKPKYARKQKAASRMLGSAYKHYYSPEIEMAARQMGATCSFIFVH
jgi:hypothetical protein